MNHLCKNAGSLWSEFPLQRHVSIVKRFVFLLAIVTSVLGCGESGESEQLTIDLEHVSAIGDSDGVTFGDLHRMTSGDSGVLYVADGNRQLYALDRDGEMLARGGQRGPGPGEFESAPAALALHGDSLFVVESSARTIHVFDSELNFVRRTPITVPGFTPREIVSVDGGLYAGGLGGSAETRLVELTDDLNDYEPISLVGSHHDLAWDTFLLDASENALVVAYIFRNIVEVHPTDGQEPLSFSVEVANNLPDPPPIDESSVVSRDNMPSDPYIWSLTLDSEGRIYLLAYHFSNSPSKDVYVYSPDGTRLTTLTLTEPTERIYIDENDRLYASTKERTELSIYDMHFTETD